MLPHLGFMDTGVEIFSPLAVWLAQQSTVGEGGMMLFNLKNKPVSLLISEHQVFHRFRQWRH